MPFIELYVRGELPASIVTDPAELAYRFEECIRCMYFEAREGRECEIPSLVPTVDELMTAALADRRWFSPSVSPRFRLYGHKVAVRSEPLPFMEQSIEFRLAGTCDAIIEVADGRLYAAKYVPVTEIGDTANRYMRELNGFIHALEHPLGIEAKPLRIAGAAIVTFTETLVPLRWTEIERHWDAYLRFMRSIGRILVAPKAPPPAPQCPRCKGA